MPLDPQNLKAAAEEAAKKKIADMDKMAALDKIIDDCQIAYKKMEFYCAYRERCTYEVKSKLYELTDKKATNTPLYLTASDKEEIIERLQEENYLNDQRYADSFTYGRVHYKKWGSIKIKQHLQQKKIDAVIIEKAWKKIDYKDYKSNLYYLIEKKNKEYYYKLKDTFKRKQKLGAFLINKGYTPNLVWSTLNEYYYTPVK